MQNMQHTGNLLIGHQKKMHTKRKSMRSCVCDACVCVCVRERKRERNGCLCTSIKTRNTTCLDTVWM